MIPKIIHCFWAGGPKTKLAEKCLASWRKFAPDWEIREWTLGEDGGLEVWRFGGLEEKRGDGGLEEKREISKHPNIQTSKLLFFVREASRLKRWAAVSDYVRMWALKEQGGVYFDFDVELIRGIDDLTDGEWFAEETHPIAGKEIAPGLGMGLEAGSPIATRMLELYDEQGFDPSVDMMNVIIANLKDAIACSPRKPKVYPPDWFSPVDFRGKMRITDNTRAIHWYAMSWASPRRRITRWLSWHGMRGIIDVMLWVKNGMRSLEV